MRPSVLPHEPARAVAARPGARIAAGETIAPRTLATILGKTVTVPETGRFVHLQFRRFAGCPVCSLHLRSIVRRYDEIVAAGIREVVVFHSTAEELRRYAADLPFAVVADPRKVLYAEFGVEASPRSLLDPRAWGPVAKAVAASLRDILRGRPVPAFFPEGGRTGLPADFLIAPDGHVVALKYGEHVYDQWSVDALLGHAAGERDRPVLHGRGTGGV